MGNEAENNEQEKTDDQVRSLIAEVTILRKEVHHRVRNTLQLICELLDLQTDFMPDNQSRIYCKESKNRIVSMALAHELLPRSRDFAPVDFSGFISNLAACLFNSYVKNPDRIRLSLDVDTVHLASDLLIPCGLIINELLSNSLKHAFPDNGKGEIHVSLKGDSEGWITLAVADNGVGLQDGLDFRNSPSLGLEIVLILIKQLKGRLTLGGQMVGTSISITFPRFT